ncbi:hypothetical protein D3C71_2029970 [compost metagenome]
MRQLDLAQLQVVQHLLHGSQLVELADLVVELLDVRAGGVFVWIFLFLTVFAVFEIHGAHYARR